MTSANEFAGGLRDANESTSPNATPFHFIISQFENVPMRIHSLFYLTVSILTGCAMAPNDEVKSDVTKQSCGHEYQTGSNLPMKHCKAKASAAQRQRNIDEIRDGLDALSAKPIGTGG